MENAFLFFYALNKKGFRVGIDDLNKESYKNLGQQNCQEFWQFDSLYQKDLPFALCDAAITTKQPGIESAMSLENVP